MINLGNFYDIKVKAIKLIKKLCLKENNLKTITCSVEETFGFSKRFILSQIKSLEDQGIISIDEDGNVKNLLLKLEDKPNEERSILNKLKGE